MMKNKTIMTKEIMNLNELSEYTGISKSHLYYLLANGKLKGNKPFGKLLFFDKKQIDELFSRYNN
ncbi:MAG: helix-turn-helix domain-containing protein [Saprospiraceae bacterium]|jgi:excisionase family DNA binding protein|nr:helix-turn-helix domain-containing protein [Saprospiraceae bacterium]